MKSKIKNHPGGKGSQRRKSSSQTLYDRGWEQVFRCSRTQQQLTDKHEKELIGEAVPDEDPQLLLEEN